MKNLLIISSMFFSMMFSQISLSIEDVVVIGEDYVCEPGEDVGTATGQTCEQLLGLFGFTCDADFAGAPLTEICAESCFDSSNCPAVGTGSLSVYYDYTEGSGTTGPLAGFEIPFTGFELSTEAGAVVASGGEAEAANFGLSNNIDTVIGFSSQGATLPYGENLLLTQVFFQNYGGADICFEYDESGDFAGTISDNVGGDISTDLTCFSPSLGCTDETACNYNPDAVLDDGSCAFEEDCNGVCGGTAVVDCANECGGSAVVDCANECGGSATVDCSGICGGEAYEDNCGECDADPANDCTEDCNGVLDGDATEDECGVCDNDPTNDCVEDCNGVFGGDAELDCNNICNGGSVIDCNDVCNGGAVVDCNGVCGGDAAPEDCGCTDFDVNTFSFGGANIDAGDTFTVDLSLCNDDPVYGINLTVTDTPDQLDFLSFEASSRLDGVNISSNVVNGDLVIVAFDQNLNTIISAGSGPILSLTFESSSIYESQISLGLSDVTLSDSVGDVINFDVVDGIVNVSGEEPPPVAPDAPTDLVVTAGDSEVSLSWSASFGASEYQVWREETAGGGGNGGNGNIGSDCTIADGQYAGPGFIDCFEFCSPASWIGDGYCDDQNLTWGANFFCEEFAFDGGDCGDGNGGGGTTGCQADEFECGDGACITGSYFCDGTLETGATWPADCADGSDEGIAICCDANYTYAASGYDQAYCGGQTVSSSSFSIENYMNKISVMNGMSNFNYSNTNININAYMDKLSNGYHSRLEAKLAAVNYSNDVQNINRDLIGYEIYRDGSLVASVGSNQTSYDDYVAAGQEYCYVVKAQYDEGLAAGSNEACASALAPPSFAGLSVGNALATTGETFTLDISLQNDEALEIAGFEFTVSSSLASLVGVSSTSLSEEFDIPTPNLDEGIIVGYALGVPPIVESGDILTLT
ncbi:MAG: hypothetical protein CMG00_08495, partial [Candidatus Marinimicrobia bacterium]|nr:hypothetical protein [Candidatus Neomarinimicrobiota bacterium]